MGLEGRWKGMGAIQEQKLESRYTVQGNNVAFTNKSFFCVAEQGTLSNYLPNIGYWYCF